MRLPTRTKNLDDLDLKIEYHRVLSEQARPWSCPLRDSDQPGKKYPPIPRSRANPSGVCLVLVGHPLDLIKVKVQTGKHNKGIADVAVKILRSEGVRILEK